MKVLVLYRPRSEHRAVVEDFLRAFNGQHASVKVDVLDVDGMEGSTIASTYDFMNFPVIAVIRDDGSILQSWQGVDSFPSPGDVSYFASSQF